MKHPPAKASKEATAIIDKESLPYVLAYNTFIIKLGVDVQSQLVRIKLDNIINANIDRVRKLRLKGKRQKRLLIARTFVS